MSHSATESASPPAVAVLPDPEPEYFTPADTAPLIDQAEAAIRPYRRRLYERLSARQRRYVHALARMTIAAEELLKAIEEMMSLPAEGFRPDGFQPGARPGNNILPWSEIRKQWGVIVADIVEYKLSDIECNFGCLSYEHVLHHRELLDPQAACERMFLSMFRDADQGDEAGQAALADWLKMRGAIN